MAAIVVSSPTPAYCQRIESLSHGALLKIGLDGQGFEPDTDEVALGLTAGEIARQCLELALKGYVTLRVEGTTDTNTADSDALNLSDVGVTFPAATVRRLEVVAKVAQAAEVGLIHQVAIVSGANGTTPEVDGQVALVNLTDAVDVGGDPVIDIEVSSNEVIVEAVGDADVDTRWDIEVRVFPATSLAFLATS